MTQGVFKWLGVAQRVRARYSRPNENDHVILRNWYGNHKRGLHRFDPNCTIDGLEHALKHPSVERSKFIWEKVIRPLHYQINGIVEYSTRQDYSLNRRTEECISTVGNHVLKIPWLPSGNGMFTVPSALSLEDLPDDFTKDEQLAVILGMQTSLSADINALTDRHGKQLTRLQNDKLRAFIVDPTLLDNFEIPRRAPVIQQAAVILNNDEELDYLASLDSSFNRDDKAAVGNATRNSLSRPRNSAGLSDKSKESLQRDIQLEPDKDDRLSLELTIKWEDKNTATREFLHDEYDGRCQICDFTFNTWAAGHPYFEGVYIVAHRKARWVDRPGNVLCLCANHTVQFQYVR